MRPQGDGWWRATTRLGAGEYRFRYEADGEPYPDYASHGIEMDKTGIKSVLVVPVTTRQQSDLRPRPVRMVA